MTKRIPKLLIILGIFFLLIALAATSLLNSQPKPKSKLFRAQLQTIKTQTGPLQYYVRGSGSPLLLLPGFGMNMQDWDPELISQLSKEHKLIILDYPEVKTEQQVTEAAVTVMDKLSIKKADILGWSMGSFVAQLLAEYYPDRVNKLVLISTATGGTEMIGASEEISRTIQDNIGGSWEESYVPYLFPQDSEKAKDVYLARRKEAITTGEFPQEEATSVSARIALEDAFANPAQEQDRADKLSLIKAPTLIIAGDKDVLLPAENAKRTAKHIAGARLEIIPNTGHAVLFHEVDTVSNLINLFLR